MDQIVPLTNDPNQTFNINLTVDGANLKLRLFISYNLIAGYWEMQISDPNTGDIMVDTIPLVTMTPPIFNLLGQYKYLEIGSAGILNVGNSPLDYPDDKTLGTDFQLIWGDTNA